MTDRNRKGRIRQFIGNAIGAPAILATGWLILVIGYGVTG